MYKQTKRRKRNLNRTERTEGSKRSGRARGSREESGCAGPRERRAVCSQEAASTAHIRSHRGAFHLEAAENRCDSEISLFVLMSCVFFHFLVSVNTFKNCQESNTCFRNNQTGEHLDSFLSLVNQGGKKFCLKTRGRPQRKTAGQGSQAKTPRGEQTSAGKQPHPHCCSCTASPQDRSSPRATTLHPETHR